jgi:type II secretory pathway pseudopilin PulG
MCEPTILAALSSAATTAAPYVAAAATVHSVSEQKRAISQASDAQKMASEQAAANNKATADAAATANNKATAKTPNPLNLYADNLKAAASTELTGPGGVDKDLLKLGRTSLLGA